MTTRNELRERLRKHPRAFASVSVRDGESYTIRSLTMKEKGENELIPVNIKTASVDTSKISRQKCDLLCLSVVDDTDKEPLFTRDEWEVWQDMAAPVTGKLLAAIEKLNEGESADELVKNSVPTGD